MRQWVKAELKRLRRLLESYKARELSDADIRVILRGKALEFYSRHYGQVFTSENEPLSIRDALLGINQLLDEDTGQPGESPAERRSAGGLPVPAALRQPRVALPRRRRKEPSRHRHRPARIGASRLDRRKRTRRSTACRFGSDSRRPASGRARK